METHEPEVLEGMGAILKDNKPTLLIEILNDEVAYRIEQLIYGLGYVFNNIDERNPPVPVNVLTKSDYYNFLICQPEVARSLGLPSLMEDQRVHVK